MAERSCKALEGTVADADDAVGGENRADLVELCVGGAATPERKGSSVPDGVDDDVVYGAQWTEAVAADEEPAGEGGPELGGGQP